MKIEITFEKADILRILGESLEKTYGLRVTPGTKPDYKGALQVKLVVDVENGEKAEPKETPKKATAPKESASAEEMQAVLQQSRRIEQTIKPQYGPSNGGLQAYTEWDPAWNKD